MKIEIEKLSMLDGCLLVKPVISSKHLVYSLVDEHRKSGKPYTADIEPTKKKRSLNSNSYCWHLVGKMADLLRRSKEEIYLEMLKQYGQSQLISVVAQGEETLKKCVKYYEEAGESTLNGKLFKHFKVYEGSSEFDQKQMAILLDGIVEECKALDIETLTNEQISLMNSLWGA